MFHCLNVNQNDWTLTLRNQGSMILSDFQRTNEQLSLWMLWRWEPTIHLHTDAAFQDIPENLALARSIVNTVITINCFKVYHRLTGPDKYQQVWPVLKWGGVLICFKSMEFSSLNIAAGVGGCSEVYCSVNLLQNQKSFDFLESE